MVREEIRSECNHDSLVAEWIAFLWLKLNDTIWIEEIVFHDHTEGDKGFRIKNPFGASVAAIDAVDSSRWSESMTGHPGENTEEKPNQRNRSTKQQTGLKTMAATHHKMNYPDSSGQESANAADMPLTTLRQRDEWIKWSQMIDGAQQHGNIGNLRKRYDARALLMTSKRPNFLPG